MLLPIIGLIAALGFLGVFFSLTREIFEGHVLYQATDEYGHSHKSPVPGVSVQLYERSTVEQWLSNDLVSSLVQWKDPKKEREALNELVSIYQGLLTVYPSNTQPSKNHKNRIAELSEYSSHLENPISAAAAHFPKELFVDLRKSIPQSLFHPVLSLFFSKKDTLQAPKRQSFFDYLESTFPQTSSFVLSSIKKDFESMSWDNLLDYQPQFEAEQAAFFIEQFTQVDKIALTLLQYAVNDEGIVHMAPKPLQIQSSDADGRVQFKIPRYSKLFKINQRNDFVVVAISNNQSVHPGQAFAWLKSIHIDPDAMLLEEKLPFWPAVQSFFLTNDSATAQYEVHLNKKPMHLNNGEAPLKPLKFSSKPRTEALFTAISLLSNSSEHHLHSHIHPHNGHSDQHSHKHSHSSHSAIPDTNFELFKKKPAPTAHHQPKTQSFKLLDEEIPVKSHTNSPASGNQPPQKSNGGEFDLLDEMLMEPVAHSPSPPSSLPTSTPPPPENSSSLPSSSVSSAPRVEDLYGIWVNTDDHSSYIFTPQGAFTFTIESLEILTGYFLLDDRVTPATLELIDQSDSTVIPAIIEFKTDKSFQIELGTKGKPAPANFSPPPLVYHRTN